MADRDGRPTGSGGDPDFDWLYGSSSRRDPSSPSDPDATQVQPQPRSAVPPRGGAPRDPEPTRVLPTLDRRDRRDRRDRPSAGAGTAPARPVPPAGPPPGPARGPVGSGGSARRRGPRPRLRWIGYVVALWVVFLVAVPLVAWSRVDKVDATPSGSRPAEQGGTTYLLVGSDSRAGLTAAQKRRLGTGDAAGQRTDTIMLLHTGSGPNLLMSIPRDSIVPVPGYGRTKINAAYAFGGPKLLVRTIEQDTGIRIDDYVQIGFAGFVDVVDAVDGITICPETAMKDRRANLDIPKGCQHAGGRKALGYARSRHSLATGDIGRAKHQREVVSAVGAKAASPWTVLNPFRYFRLAMAGSTSVAVGDDTGMLATAKFAYAMTKVTGSDGLTCSVPISDLAVHWDPVRSKRMFRLIATDRTNQIGRTLCRQTGLPG